MAQLDIKSIEEKWKSYWGKNKIYKFDTKKKDRIYSIDTPPPTVSGKMHIGHAFSYSQQDFIARYKRMQGFNVFYPFGTDDNGLPTEKLIEKEKKVKSKNMQREDFIKLCLSYLKTKAQPGYLKDWQNIAISCDWDLLYSTIDDESRALSQKSFIELYNGGLIYKKEFPTIFDTSFQTPVAQAELVDLQKDSLFTTLKFTCENKVLPIATTRPELLPACVAVFVNPKDKRYNKLIGKEVTVPLFNQTVKIYGDDSAEIDKGTGVLMVCSYGDKYDVDAIQRLKLEPKIVISKDGKLTAKPYNGLNTVQARKKILEDLDKLGLIIEQKKITHVVNVHEKSQKEIEFLPTEQWFIKILDKKKKLIDQGKKIKWYPSFMQKRYENWISGLEWDWSISRDRHFGIPIPVWYTEDGEVILADESELPVDPTKTKKVCKKTGKTLIPETRVLDTWATSSLTPTIASNLTKGKVKEPYSLRPQAHDIIRTWAFYTIIKSLYHKNTIPWKEITISGFVKLKGQKMSKSLGNIVAPQVIIEEYGADALRFWAASSKLGEDFDYQEKDVVTGKKFLTKLLNVSNFVFMNLEHQKNAPKLMETDRIFLGELNKVIKKATSSFEDYNYSHSKLEAEKFFYKVLADNYLEIVKNRVYNGNKEEKSSAFYTLYTTLYSLLRLFAPITPFITEEIYQTHFKKYEKDKSIHLSPWPTPLNIDEKKDDAKKWQTFLEIITNVRSKKSENKKSMKSEILLTISEDQSKLIDEMKQDLISVTNSKELKVGTQSIEFFD